MLIDAVRRAMIAIAKSPSKMGLIFTPEGWRQFSKVAREKSLEQIIADRKAAFSGGGWSHQDEVSTRRYESYDSYLEHQKTKLGLVHKRLVEKGENHISGFKERFEYLVELMPKSSVLCLAARMGHEVQALIQLGHFAIGIDLNPGESNRFVVTGDFHALQFADASLDCVFSNSLDHAFDIKRIASEVFRVLKPGGLFVVDLMDGYEEGALAGEFEALHWPTAKGFAEHIAVAGGFDLLRVSPSKPEHDFPHHQCVMRKRNDRLEGTEE